MLKVLILSPGPVLTCLLAIFLLLVFLLLSIKCGLLYYKANTRIFFCNNLSYLFKNDVTNKFPVYIFYLYTKFCPANYGCSFRKYIKYIIYGI